jgi:hypothetical protein
MPKDSPAIRPADGRGTGPEPAGSPPPADPAALTVAQLAKLLRLPELKVRQHVDAGAPTGAEGTINLVQYVAWLNARLTEREPHPRLAPDLRNEDGD